MSEENQEVEQITTPPTLTAPKSKKEARPKDPKKVAAGKKLVEYNRKAKEALKREEEREEMERSAGEGTSDAWMPEISFTTALSVAGVGLTLLDLLSRYRANSATDKTPQAGPLVRAERRANASLGPKAQPTEAPHVEAPHVEASVRPKTGQPPKFGMD